jgi:hypothetical protein
MGVLQSLFDGLRRGLAVVSRGVAGAISNYAPLSVIELG